MMDTGGAYAAFAAGRVVARGDLPTVARAVHGELAARPIILEDATGRTVDVDLRDPIEDVLARLAPPKAARGRPKLGVTAREVTLLPRHWDWLAAQPGGASATLRRLVEEARRSTSGEDERRQAQEAAYRVATTLAGDRPGYEDAIRALFASDLPAFHRLIAVWPPDIAAYLRDLTAPLAGPS